MAMDVHNAPKSDLRKLEYRVKEKKIWHVTRYCEFGDDKSTGHSITDEGRFDDPLMAHRAASALCQYDALSYGVGADDPRVVFPSPLEYDEPSANPPGDERVKFAQKGV